MPGRCVSVSIEFPRLFSSRMHPQLQGGWGTTTGSSNTAPLAGAYPMYAWQSGWPGTYPVPSSSFQYQQQQRYSNLADPQYQLYYQPNPQPISSASHLTPKFRQKARAKSPSPSPPPSESHHHWDAVLKKFMGKMGLTQAICGFESDMLIMNSDWERRKAPAALADLVKDLLVWSITIRRSRF